MKRCCTSIPEGSSSILQLQQASLHWLRPGFIISQGQGSQHRRQSPGAWRQADGPSLASWPSALPGGGGLKARPHHWLVERGGLQPTRQGQESGLFSGTGDRETPTSHPTARDMSLTLGPPLQPASSPLGPSRGYSILNSSIHLANGQGTKRVEWQRQVHCHQHSSLSPGLWELCTHPGPSPALKTDRQ